MIKFNLLVAVDLGNRLHEFLVLELAVPAVNGVVFEPADPSSFHSLQQQHQVVLVDCHLLTVADPLLDLGGEKVALVVAVHQSAAQIFVDVGGEEVQHYLLLLQGLLSSGQLDAAVGAVLEGLEGTVEIEGLGGDWAVDCFVDGVPVDVFVVLQNFDLDCLLRDFVLDAFLLQLLQNRPHRLLQASGDIEQVDLPPDLLNHRQLLLEPGNGLHIDFHLINGAVVDPDDSILLQRLEYLPEQLGGDLMLPAKRIHPDHLLLVLLGVLLANGIAIQQFIFNVIRVETLLALLFPSHCLLHHLHYYLLEVVVGDQLSCDAVSVVMVVVLLEEQQFLLGGEGRLHEFYDVGEGVVDGDVEVAEAEEVGVLGDGDVAVGDTLDQLEDLLFLLVALESGQHILSDEAVHFGGAEVVKQVDGGPRLEQQLFVEEVGLLPAVDEDQDAFELVLGEVAHHILELVLMGSPKHDEVELRSLGPVDLRHVVERQVLAVVLGHQGVVEPEYAVGIGLGDDPGDEGGLVVIEMHVADQQQVAFELMVLLTLEKRRCDEQQFQLLQLVQLKHSDLVLRLLVCAQESPSQFGQSADFLHPRDPKGGILGHNDRSAFDLLMQDLHESGRRVERQVGQSTELLTLLQPVANVPDLLRDLHQGLLRCCGWLIAGVGVKPVLLEQMREILIKTDLEERFLKKRPLDGLVMLEVYVIPNDISKAGRTRVGVDVLLLLLHLKFNLK